MSFLLWKRVSQWFRSVYVVDVGTVKLVITGRAMKLTKEESQNLIAMDVQSLENIEDMVNLKQLDEPSILHNLRMRFSHDEIYTYIGDILISVNPFKKLPIYSPEVVDAFIKKGSREQGPHIFGVADKAFSALVNNRKDQSCIVSGESGAGKTEATKLFLNYLAEKSSSGNTKTKANSTALQQRILEANPLMEAFGNAKTVRNDNSSRFGKLIQVQLDNQRGQIVGGSITQYLLEKSRLVNQAVGERNYHIFYQLCEAASVDSKLKKKLNLDFAAQYYYLNQDETGKSMIVESINDLTEWENTLQAMNVIDIKQADRDSLMVLLAGILHLGNVEFEGNSDDSSKVTTPSFVESAAKLFQVDAQGLNDALIKRKLRESFKLHSVDQAVNARDAFSKAVYGLLFEWLIEQINISLKQNSVPGSKLSAISVLDIFGFESFKINSYEQLCINYCNEKLQGHFNEHIFKLEQELYKKEGINLDKIVFADNSYVLKLIEEKGGIFHLIDEQNKLPKGSDAGFLAKVKDMSADEKVQQIVFMPDVKELRKKENQVVFKVKHYAGVVGYTVTQFLEKNKDALLEDLYQLGLKSKSSFMNALFKRSKGAKENKKTIGSQFREQLAVLMKTLSATEPHYVRTIKPNSEKVSDTFTAPMVLDQMKYAGLMEVCRIRKLGYPIRKDFKEFVFLYTPLVKEKVTGHAALCKALEGANILVSGEYQIGKSKIFLRTEMSNALEAGRDKAIRSSAVNIQRVARGFVARRRFGKLKSVLKDVEAAVKARDAAKIEAALQKTGILPHSGQHLPAVKNAKQVLAKLHEEAKVLKLLQSSMGARDLNAINGAIKAAEKLGMKAKELDQAKKLVVTIEKEKKTLVDLEAAVKANDVGKVQTLLKTAEQLKLNENSVVQDAIAIVRHDEELKKVIAALEKANKAKDVAAITENMTKMANLGALDHPAVKKGQEIAKAVAKASQEKETEKKETEKKLKAAIEARDLGLLKDLKLKVIQLGITGATVDAANKVVKELQSREEKLSLLSSEMQTFEIKAKSYDGITQEDLARLSKFLEDVKKEGFKDTDEELVEAKAFEQQMKDQLKAQQQVSEALKSGDKGKLLKALEVIQRLGLETGEAKEVEAEIREIEEKEAEAKASQAEANRLKIRGQIKEGTAEELIEEKKKLMAKTTKEHATLVETASDGTKFHYSKFYRVREDQDFLEYVPAELRDSVIAEKFKAQRRIVPKSMLALNGDLNRMGLQVHKAVLCYCGDLSHPFPNTMASYLVTTGLENPDVVDEIYMHLCKHTTKNGRAVSEDRAWGLMCIMTASFPPSKEFAPFLVNHLVANRNRPLLIGNYARLCIVQLDGRIRLGPTRLLPTAPIVDGYSQRPPILAVLHQVGKKPDLLIPVAPHEDVDHVMEIACERAKVPEPDQFKFGCYVIDGKPKTTLSLKERLTFFYKKYNRSKLQHIDYFVSQWIGNEEALFLRLESKYGPEPTPQEIAKMNNQAEKGSLLTAPVSAVKKAAKRLGLVNQNQAVPSPDSSWPLPWWVFLGDVYLRMIKQGRVPIFTFKRKLYVKKEPVTEELAMQAADEFSEGTITIQDESNMIKIAAMKIMLYSNLKPPKTVEGLLEGDERITNIFPAKWLTEKTPAEYAPIVLKQLGLTAKDKKSLIEGIWNELTKSAAFGKVFFYLSSTESDEVFSAGVDPAGIHTFNEDRTEITFTYEYRWIKEFGASAAYFWMKYVPKQGGTGNAAYGKDGETIYLNTFQAWDLYSLVYDYTYNAKDLNLV